MVDKNRETVLIHVNIELTSAALEHIVQRAKQMTGRNQKGYYRVDTADVVNKMISHFLLEKDFESFAKNPENYPALVSSASDGGE